EAIDHFKRVLEITGDLNDNSPHLEEEYEGNYGLAQATLAAGHLVEAMTIFETALTLARRIGSTEKFALCSLGFDEAQFLTGQVPEASKKVLREALEGLSEAEGNLRCQVLSRLGRAHRMSGDGATALVLDREAILLVRKLGDDRALFDVLSGS